MAMKLYSDSDISDIADAIRSKNGSSDTYKVSQMASAIQNIPNSYSASDEGKVVSNGALVAQTSDTVTANDTYDTTLINSLTVNVSGGSSIATYTHFASGTVTFSERYQTTGNRTIVSLASIGFTPTQFYFIANDDTSKDIYTSITGGTETKSVITYASFIRFPLTPSTYWYSRLRVRFRADVSPNAIQNANDNNNWTTQTNGYLYNDGTNICFRTADNFGLPKDKTYTWIALAE